jgi:aryl-alcohol dehydrogenase-like predicted oxidoreductase
MDTSRNRTPAIITRREALALSLGAGATLALTPTLLAAFQQAQPAAKLLHRPIPSTGELLPVIGLQFPNNAAQDPAPLKEVLKALVSRGGRFLDTMHNSVPGVEDRTAKVVTELNLQDKLFLGLRANPPGPPPADPAAATRAQIESLFTRFKVAKLDLLQLGVQSDPGQLAAVKELKKDGRARYIGTTVIVDHLHPALETMMRNEPIDFIGVHYGIDKRTVEDKILPLAQERKIGVIAYFPFGVGSLFKRVGSTPLPDWAAEFDATTWAQFFLKYVISHPAVTMVRAGTTNPAHMLDNIGGGTGRLPDEATRKRMAALIDALPPAPAPYAKPAAPAAAPAAAVPAAVLDRYVGQYKSASGFTLTLRREGDTLLAKPGPGPEAALIARSETVFSDPRGPTLEFQLDAQGKPTTLTLDQGGKKTTLERQ